MTKRLAFMLALALGACVGSGTGRVEYGGSVTVRSPELVTVEPDVYVLADADEPVFYTDNYYWLYRDNRWYRSHNYDSGWITVSSPSPRLRHIDRPTSYARYRARTQEARNAPLPPRTDDRGKRDDRGGRDFRDQDEAPFRPTRPAQAPPPYPRPPQREAPRDSVPPRKLDERRLPPGRVDRPPVQVLPDKRNDVRPDDRPDRARDERHDRDHDATKPHDDKRDKPDKKKPKKHDH